MESYCVTGSEFLFEMMKKCYECIVVMVVQHVAVLNVTGLFM